MANLLSNTTIGGYQSIHTGNIGSYALTSITSGQVTTALGYTPYNATNPSAYITSSNNYYYVNPGNGYGLGFWGQVPTTYGITMANESAGYGVIYGLSEYHLYFSMTGGGSRGFVFRNDAHGAVTQIGAYGWQMWRGELYPGYNNATSGSQTSYYIYGNTNSGGIRTNGNWIVNGDIYLGTRDAWLSTWLNQDVRTSASPTFAQVFSSGWFRNYGQQGIYNQDYSTHFYSNSSSAWAITGSGGNVELQFRSNHQSTVRGYVHANTSNEIGFLSEDGAWVLRTWNRGVQAYGSMRSPIYYDSDDTSYYADFASTSDSAVRVRGGALFGPNPTWGAYLQVGGNGNNSGSYASVVTTNGNLHLDATNGSSTYINHYYGSKIHFGSGGAGGGTYIHSNFSAAGYLNLGGGSGDASYRLDITGTGRATGDFRAPIFYDSADTGYYLDPNATTNIWRLQANDKYHYFGGSSNWDNGNLNGENSVITNVHFQGHPDFWIGAGNTKWYTSVASGHHDLLINTMQSGGSNVRGITFTASSSGASVYRLGRWFAHSTQVGSYLNVDGGIKIGGTTDTYSPPAAKLQVISSTVGSDVFAVDGVNGRLFTVTDDLTDSLFSVNTIAGLPVIEAFADNTVKIGKYGSNSITISNSKIAINSDLVDSNFPFYVGDRSVAGSRYSLTNPGMGFNLADNYAQLQLFGGNGSYIDFVTASGQDSAGRIMWDGNFNIQGTTYFANNIYTYTLYDRNDTGYYLDMNGTSRLGTLNINQLSVYGNTYLGDGNGDEVHINDILRVGATDSGDAHFYFGEGGSAGSDYGSHWYWDSGYRFTWYTRNAGTDSTLFYYDTNSLSYITWGRSISMNNNSIDYTGQLHFNGGTRFQSVDTHYLKFRTDATDYGSIQVRDANETLRGYLGYFDANGFGLLNSSGSWGIRLNPGNGDTILYSGGNWKLTTTSAGVAVDGNVYTNQNYGHGLVGLYASTRYQGVFAMGDSYKLAADGTGTGTLYGIAWTHTNVGGQSKSGLGHQALFMDNGVTQTAIGSGIWTNGLITSIGYGTSADWNTAYGWGNHASAGYLTSGSLSGYATQSWVNSQGFLTSVPAQSQLISPNGATVVAADSAMPNAGHSFIHSLALGPGGNDGHILGMSWAGTNSIYGAQIFLDTDPNDIMAIRSRSSAGVWTSWKTIYHSGNFTDNSSNWNTAFGWGNHASAGYVTSSALSSYVPRSGAELTEGNYFYFRSNRGAYLGATDSAPLQAYATGGNAAFMSFHRSGNYAVNFGLDSDNIMRIGGWSASADRWVLDMSGNNTVAGSFRAPIFYDSADTSYYLDPNSTSRLYYVNAPQGYVSVGNPWGTANSAYFPNGITTAGSDNWIYGHTYVGNAPTNGSGHEFWDTGKEYHRSNEASSSHGASGRWVTRQSANGNYAPYSFESDYGNHSYGVIARYHISNNGGSDRPSITFSSGYNNTRWSVGYCYYDDQFRITQNMGLAPDGSDGIWGSERLRIDTSGTLYSNGNAVITSANIGSQSVSYASSAGNADTVDGFHASVGASANTIPTRNSSGYLIPESWIQLNGIYGLYSPTNGAHLRPNSGSYGSWQMTGSRNGWQGIEFDSGSAGNISLMVAADSNTVGFHNNNYGWQFRWNGGTLYCYKNAYGAGTEATVLDSSNYSSWAQPIASAINTGNIGSQSVSNASTAGGLAVHSSRNNEANKIVRTDANGYIQAGWINTPSGVFSSAITKIYCSDDDYVRYQTPATFISNLGLITTSNIGSQSVSYATTAGTANAVAWGNVSSKPSLLMYYQGFTLDANTMDGNSTGFTYSVNAPYTGPIARFSETGYSLQLNAAYSGGGTGIAFRTRNGDTGSFNTWRVLLNDSNYTAYSPSLTGSGASGSWGISVTGSAGSVAWTNVSSRPTALSQFSNDLGNYGGFLTSLGFSYSTGVTGNHVVQRDANGYIYASHINFSTGESENPTISSFITSDGDGWSRKSSLAHVRNQLGNYGGWLTTGGKAADSELFDGTDSIYFVKGNGVNTLGYRTTGNSGANSAGGLSSGFYDGSGMSNMPTSDWYHLIVNAHHNSSTSNQYEFQLATAFWNKSDFFVRSISPGDVGPWRTLVHNGNIGSQSVSYASTSGSATTAGSATMAQQLSKFGDIYGQDWNSYYVSGKLIVANALGHSGANRPNLTYDYGVALSYGETGGPLLQMYFPENSGNIGTIFRKGTYRTGWNGNWSTWKTLVEQEGNTCTIVGGNGTGLEVHGNVGYNQDPLTYFLLRGQADTSWKALKVRLTGDAGGQDIEFRRIAENTTDSRMFYIPRGANTVNFDYPIVQPSDSRLKDNITSISTPVEKIKSLRGVEFDWNSGEQVGTHDVGLIAQDVEAVLPEAVTTQEDGYKNLAYTKVIPLLVEAMKEQQALIEALRAEVELLKNK